MPLFKFSTSICFNGSDDVDIDIKFEADIDDPINLYSVITEKAVDILDQLTDEQRGSLEKECQSYLDYLSFQAPTKQDILDEIGDRKFHAMKDAGLI